MWKTVRKEDKIIVLMIMATQDYSDNNSRPTYNTKLCLDSFDDHQRQTRTVHRTLSARHTGVSLHAAAGE